MLQTYLADEDFLKEYCFEYSPRKCSIRAADIFARSFGDREFIPQSFKIVKDNQELSLIKTNMTNNGSQIIFTYEGSGLVILVFL